MDGTVTFLVIGNNSEESYAESVGFLRSLESRQLGQGRKEVVESENQVKRDPILRFRFGRIDNKSFFFAI